MHFGAVRRPGKTYGKANKTVRVHDLFDQRANHGNGSSNTPQKPSVSPSPDERSYTTGPMVEEGNSFRGADSAHMSVFSHVSNDSSAPITNLSAAQSTSLFDIQSSDDGASTDTSDSRSSKRRRTTKLAKDIKKPVFKRTLSSSSRPRGVVSTTRRMNEPQETKASTLEITIPSPRIVVPELRIPSTETVASKVKQPNSKAQAPHKKLVNEPPSQVSSRTQKIMLSSRQKGKIEVTRQSANDASEYLTDHSQQSAVSHQATPKRKRLSPPGTDSDLSSPSQLGLTSLKVNTASLTPARNSPEFSSDGSQAPRNSRQRLIDRLDAPSKATARNSERPFSSLQGSSATAQAHVRNKSRGKSVQTHGKKYQLPRSVSASEEPESSDAQTIRMAKPRTTYASQRSHLSDMMEGLDSLEPRTSQTSTNELLFQTQPSNIASQLELEEESDDQASAARVKSIHELRQAGANNRFDREVDALLEDISVDSHLSKAIRLQALIKLMTKLNEPNFLGHFATSSRVQRLTSITTQPIDLPTSVLLVGVFSLVVQSADIPLDTLKWIFKAATNLAPDMLADSRSLTTIAKERKQNLSKTMIQDLAEVEKIVGHQTDISTISGRFFPDLMSLTCLERTLRRLVQLSDKSARLSTSVYIQVLRLVQTEVQHLQLNNRNVTGLRKLEAALSLLELCSVVVDDADLHVGDDEYKSLGNALAEIISKTDRHNSSLEKTVLRVIVSLSNNRPRMCQLLGHTDINKATFDIINDNFPSLAQQAENEEVLDESKLDSVVLALGCLLNFAECDPTLRTRLSEMTPGKNNYIARLVSIFNSQVSKVDEALTNEQGQVSVAFGYLSMLLCTLSLHPSIRTQVTQLLKNHSFAGLCTAAEKFFSHLRTLEHISEDDASMTTFTARFRAILDTVRVQPTSKVL